MRFSVDRLVAFDILLFAAMTFAAGRVQTFSLLCLVLFASGTAWIGILACLNIAAQTMCPSFLRARALSMYLLVLQGGMALGSTALGRFGDSSRSSDRSAMFGGGDGRGTARGPPASPDVAAVGTNAVRSSRLV